MSDTEFAGCLMIVGAPDVIGMAGSVRPRPGKHLEQRGQDWKDSAPISSLDYMRRCEVYFYDHVVKPQQMVGGRASHEGWFVDWWTAYKYWLMENHNESCC